MFQKISDSGLTATVLCASLILSACSGGGGSGSSGGSGGDATTLKAGLYDTDVKFFINDTETEADTYLSPKGRFVISFGAGLSFGTLGFDSSNMSGTSIDYRKPDSEGFFEERGLEGTINGTINSQGSATFSTANAAGKITTEVTLTRKNIVSDFGTSLNQASGNYEQGVSEVVLTVDPSGSLFAQYQNKCTLAGTLVPTASINVFDINYTISNCTTDFDERNGEYSGLGFFIPTGGGGQDIVFAAQNGTVAMQFAGTK